MEKPSTIEKAPGKETETLAPPCVPEYSVLSQKVQGGGSSS